jgi:MFS family permease
MPNVSPQCSGTRSCHYIWFYTPSPNFLVQTSVSTALPTIVHALNGEDFVWVGSAYSLAATAFLPLFGELADIFGRKSVMIFVMVAFMVGSAVSGAAQNMNMLIAGRSTSLSPLLDIVSFELTSNFPAIQGMGSGGILSMTEIITADMVPLRERGLYVGIIGACVLFPFSSRLSGV